MQVECLCIGGVRKISVACSRVYVSSAMFLSVICFCLALLMSERWTLSCILVWGVGALECKAGIVRLCGKEPSRTRIKTAQHVRTHDRVRICDTS